MKADRNKTIDISIDEGKEYLDKCIVVDDKTGVDTILDKTIIGDMYTVIPFLPEKFVDLLIVDPPYNLNKNFHGKKFKKMPDVEYEEYVDSWIQMLIPLLKDEASVYVCCDWQSSLIIGNVLKKYLYVQNRITWQREKGRGSISNWKNGMETFGLQLMQEITHLMLILLR